MMAIIPSERDLEGIMLPGFPCCLIMFPTLPSSTSVVGKFF